MKNKSELINMNKSPATQTEISPEPFLRFIYEENPETGGKSLKTVELSNGECSEDPEFLESVLKALKRATGSDNPEVAENILSDIAWGMSGSDSEERMRVVSAFLPSLNPDNESEALLLGQFLALRDSGMKCLRRANDAEMLCQIKELSQLSVKLMRCANETMQTLLKYRSGGKQQIQVVHVSGDGKAIISNEMNLKGGGL